MRVGRILLLVIASVLVALLGVGVAFTPKWLSAFATRQHVLRELGAQEIGPLFRRVTGRTLPPDVNDLRGIYRHTELGGSEQVFLTFRVAPQAQAISHIRQAFSGGPFREDEFPNESSNPFGWDLSGFRAGCVYQSELRIALFDGNLLDRLRDDFEARAWTGTFPADTPRGWFLRSHGSLPHYWILLFKDTGIVYVVVSYADGP